MPTQRIVSIVVPTFNRFERLRVCIDNIRRGVTVPTEVIVVDGGSQDGTRDWLGKQHDLTVILEDRRAGAVAAFNKGFRAATGHYVMWLNDDAFPLPGSVEAALETLERPDLSMWGWLRFIITGTLSGMFSTAYFMRKNRTSFATCAVTPMRTLGCSADRCWKESAMPMSDFISSVSIPIFR